MLSHVDLHSGNVGKPSCARPAGITNGWTSYKPEGRVQIEGQAPTNWWYITSLHPLFLWCVQSPCSTQVKLQSNVCCNLPWMFHEPANCSCGIILSYPILSHFIHLSSHVYPMFFPCPIFSPVPPVTCGFHVPRSWSATPLVPRAGRV